MLCPQNLQSPGSGRDLQRVCCRSPSAYPDHSCIGCRDGNPCKNPVSNQSLDIDTAEARADLPVIVKELATDLLNSWMAVFTFCVCLVAKAVLMDPPKKFLKATKKNKFCSYWILWSLFLADLQQKCAFLVLLTGFFLELPPVTFLVKQEVQTLH